MMNKVEDLNRPVCVSIIEWQTLYSARILSLEGLIGLFGDIRPQRTVKSHKEKALANLFHHYDPFSGYIMAGRDLSRYRIISILIHIIHNLAYLLYSNVKRSCFGHPSCDLSQDRQLSGLHPST